MATTACYCAGWHYESPARKSLSRCRFCPLINTLIIRPRCATMRACSSSRSISGLRVTIALRQLSTVASGLLQRFIYRVYITRVRRSVSVKSLIRLSGSGHRIRNRTMRQVRMITGIPGCTSEFLRTAAYHPLIHAQVAYYRVHFSRCSSVVLSRRLCGSNHYAVILHWSAYRVLQ